MPSPSWAVSAPAGLPPPSLSSPLRLHLHHTSLVLCHPLPLPRAGQPESGAPDDTAGSRSTIVPTPAASCDKAAVAPTARVRALTSWASLHPPTTLRALSLPEGKRRRWREPGCPLQGPLLASCQPPPSSSRGPCHLWAPAVATGTLVMPSWPSALAGKLARAALFAQHRSHTRHLCLHLSHGTLDEQGPRV